MSPESAPLSRHEGITVALYFSAYALGAVSCAFATLQLFPYAPLVTSTAIPVIALGCVFYVVARSRDSLALLMGSLSPRDRVAGALFALAAAAAPSLILRSWAVLPGLLALQVPLICVLATEAAFARYYALNGLICAIVIVRAAPLQGWLLAGLFAALLVTAMACDHWHFTLRRTPVAARANPLLPVALALRRFLRTALLTLPIALSVAFVVPLQPMRMRLTPGLRTPTPHLSGRDFESSIMRLFLDTMVVVVLLISLGALVRLYRKLRRRRQQMLPPESIGTPVGSPYEMAAAPRRMRRLNLHDPREVVVFWYEKLSERLKPRGLERKPSQTPDEYRQTVSDGLPGLAPQMGCITERFVAARYDRTPVTRDDAEAFRSEVERLLDGLRQDRE